MQKDISLTPEEVAGILKIAKNTVYELVKRGELPAYKVGRKIRIDMKDVEAYKKQGKKFEFALGDSPQALEPRLQPKSLTTEYRPSQGLVICGLDVILDVLSRQLQYASSIKTFRQQVGSFSGLSALYQGDADLVGIHLWDGDTGVYNIPYVRRLVPGIATVIIHLAVRMQGFYVASGNPQNIQNWHDLSRSQIRFVNREKGSGTRILLDEQLHRLQIDRRLINGYDREELSHLAVASVVARGEADVALGIQKASMQVRGIDFIPLQKESYELVLRKDDLEKEEFQTVIKVIQSSAFKLELQGLGDYDLTETGQIKLVE
ncbi:MAG: substrate-binding domain-containing protein [Syntrophomonadaceae bacterium]